MTARYLLGDTRDVLASLPAGSVDLVLSSPPFFALRSYLAADDPAKGSEIGSEPTPGAFIDTLLDVAEACGRVLAPHGSLVFELGDTYAGSGGGGGDYLPGGLREGQPGFTGSASKARDVDAQRAANAAHWRAKNAQRGDAPLDKSLCLIPELFRLSLAYGRNPLTGRGTDRWRVRNVVRWHRPNPAVSALGDKWRPSTSDMVVACKSARRYWDDIATRTEHSVDPATMRGNGYSKGHPEGRPGHESMPGNPYGAPLLDTWRIPTRPYKGSHYATWPPDLCAPPILAMCPERVCTQCGHPSQRLTPDEWTDCGHDSWRRGVVLDPFAGTGTTLAVAEGHGRDSIGIDLDLRNAALARERVGLFLDVSEGVLT